MILEANQSKAIDLLRFPLAIGVVLIHCYSYEINYDNNLLCNFIRILFSRVLPSFVVPLFFIISGLLFFKDISYYNFTVYKDKIHKRLKSLIIPYIFWNIFTLIYVFFREYYFHIKRGSEIGIIEELKHKSIINIFYNWKEFGQYTNIFGQNSYISAPIDIPLWFLKDIIIMIFLSPLFFYGFKCLKHYLLLFFFMLFIFNISIFNFNSTSIFFFGLGAYLSIYNKDIFKIISKTKYYSIIISILFLIILTYTDYYNGTNFISKIYIILSCLTALNVSYIIVSKKGIVPNLFLVKSSFLIYVLHGVIGTTIAKLIIRNYYDTSNELIMLICYLAKPFIATIICISIFYIMKKYTPKTLSIVTGYRN